MINIYFSYTVNGGWVVCSGKPTVNHHHVQQVCGDGEVSFSAFVLVLSCLLVFPASKVPKKSSSCLFKLKWQFNDQLKYYMTCIGCVLKMLKAKINHI